MGLSDAVQASLRPLGLQLVRRETLELLRSSAKAKRQLDFLRAMPPQCRATLFDLLPSSTAEFQQDLFALVSCGFRRDGFFVEFGACDGITGSNTLLLERSFGWKGIVAEPAKIWHETLRKERLAAVDTDCVWSASGEVLDFNEQLVAGLSTVQQFADGDNHRRSRARAKRYTVQTVSLLDLLSRHGAPSHINFLSLDTEGSELEILESFDFRRYSFDVIVCEHNFTGKRERIRCLLESVGYRRVHEDISAVDDWFVRQP